MNNRKDKIKNRYNRISKVYDLLERPMESIFMSQWREELIDKLEGKKILEVGVGTGKNLSYYPEGLDITGIDFSKNMLQKSRDKIKDKKSIRLIEMDAQNMKFADNTFDTVVTSFVFCSVPDPIEGLKEIRRVCKNNGKILMFEHMRSNNEVAGKFMDIINFIPFNIWGANINRKTLENLDKAGFNEVDIEYQDVWRDIVKLIEIRNKK
jgi:ubiquinone/menaquinone biosynthesis C-methylase UbiE